MSVPRTLSWGNLDLRSVTNPDEIPQQFNFATALLDRHIVAGRGSRVALLGPCGQFTYEELYRLVNQAGNALRALGVEREQRVLLLLKDSPEFVAAYLGAMKIGAVPIGLNTFTHPSDYEYYIRHSRATALVAEAEYIPPLQSFLWNYNMRAVLAVRGEASKPVHSFSEVVAAQSTELEAAPTHRDEPSHWVYSSGSTGEPKGVVHLHRNTIFCAEPYVRHVLHLTPDDITFSVARLFFSYGLMNSLYMPLWVGASSVLLPDRPEPKQVIETIEKYRPTIFFSVPTSYGRMLREDLDLAKVSSLRHCVSAGEALPAPIYEEWLRRTGLHVLDGVGSTEAGYIYLSNTPEDVTPGCSGKMLPGYRARLVDNTGREVGPGELGELQIASPSLAAYYWCNNPASKKTFLGEWMRSGDQYLSDEQGRLIYQGRSDDLFKSGGIWVSPIEVESTLLEHHAVAEVSVVAEKDAEGLEKPIAYVVLKVGFEADDVMGGTLRQFVRERLAVYKCPKAFHFVGDLPKTSSGKIQRFKLRAESQSGAKSTK